MKRRKVYIGDTFLEVQEPIVEGSFVEIEGVKHYRISNFNRMPDFFISLVSNSDHFCYISSNGSLTAGRKNRDHSLFPYYTEDKIHDYYGKTGSKTIILIQEALRNYLWEPFSKEYASVYKIERNLYKSIYGNQLIFEEINEDFDLVFRYSWSFSDKYGLVKKASIQNLGGNKRQVDVLDGILNILPSGVDYNFQNEYSNLVDAYKKSELEEKIQLGIYSLSSIPVDRAEPSESLIATTVWSVGSKAQQTLISNLQIENFRLGESVKTEKDIRAQRGAYIRRSGFSLEAESRKDWMFVVEVDQDTTSIADLRDQLSTSKELQLLVEEDIQKGTNQLIQIVGSSDGLQISQEPLNAVRHYSNTLFNVMRGGVYIDNYTIDREDLKDFIHQSNKMVFSQFIHLINGLNERFERNKILALADKTGNPDFARLSREYLPLTFSRRHGDPSRPWNKFSIENKMVNGKLVADFQGNWRDIFQNWEALSYSFPEYIEQIIAKFVNASTADGYNPYRITLEGIDWETPDPNDPWAYIGYWGDHQIIYLQKLLELSAQFHPQKLKNMLTSEVYSYANVPYKIRPYSDMVKNPWETIDFDHKLNANINELVQKIGSDGKLILNSEEEVVHVNLMEKVLVSILSKISNFVPDAGIWLNTQRPEWNDANNALVGNGASMVTLYYLRRTIQFWLDQIQIIGTTSYSLSTEVAHLFNKIVATFNKYRPLLSEGFNGLTRREFVDSLGSISSIYREGIYKQKFSGHKETLYKNHLIDFFNLSLDYIDHSIQSNRREDGLYHSYNLISFEGKELTIRYLYEMLEGQVAILSAKVLDPSESLQLLDALKQSALFRPDQYSYILYPDRNLPRFVEKNIIPSEIVQNSEVLRDLISRNDRSIISQDTQGAYHFNASFRNRSLLEKALEILPDDLQIKLLQEKELILSAYDEMFDHKSFTGRSGSFFKYEGLGSIYWHMVSKLLLAVGENFKQAVDQKSSPQIIGRLKEHYYEIKAGIGLYKSPELYGAFPTDPYSHTPSMAGAQQPGMTGQVKEDFISRLSELGLSICKGKVHFNLELINKKEFLEEEDEFYFININREVESIPLKKGQLAYTFCQVPIVYTLSSKNEVIVSMKDKVGMTESLTLAEHLSEKLFNRTGEIKKIEVMINDF